MVKTKILKILPFWLTAVFLICAVQTAASLYFSPIKQQAQNSSTLPQVLGEETSIRGESPELLPLAQVSMPDTASITAKSFLVFDSATGQELLAKNPKQQRYIASLTKLLTAFVVYENIDLNEALTITSNDKFNVYPILNFAVGDTLIAQDIFNAMLIGSTNDAALALANHTEAKIGKKFVGLMNEQAEALGMEDSHFSNALGFDSLYNYSTAEDLKKLIMATQQLAVFKNLSRRTSYKFTGELGYSYSTQATNKLIGQFPDLEAIKTGYTREAGEAMATILDYKDHKIVILVLDSKNREDDTLKLRELIKNNFR